MLVRRIVGAAVALLGLYQFWQSWRTGAFLMERGQSFGSIVSDPAFLIPGLAALLAAAGGFVALVNMRFAATLVGIGTFLSALLVLIIAGTGADSSLWLPRLPSVAGLLLGFVLLILLPRHKRVEPD